jgi:hypothetical protein
MSTIVYVLFSSFLNSTLQIGHMQVWICWEVLPSPNYFSSVSRDAILNNYTIYCDAYYAVRDGLYMVHG